MFDKIFDIPLSVIGPIIVLGFALVALTGLLLTRRVILPRLAIREADSEFSGTMVQGILVFYGLAVALISVNVWQTYAQVSGIVSSEATSLAALYRDVTGYPEPV